MTRARVGTVSRTKSQDHSSDPVYRNFYFGRPDQNPYTPVSFPHRIVEVFIARKPAVDRLPEEICQAELPGQSLSGVAQVLGDECLQPEAFIQLTHQNEARVGSDARSLKHDLQKAIERELKRLVL